MESAYVPSLREYAARWGITPERIRPGQKVMHPGPINRGVEIDGRVADSPDSLILAQVHSGLAVRMAVLQELLVARRARSRWSRDALLQERPLGQPRARRAPRRRRVRRGHGRGRCDRTDRAGGRDVAACSRRRSSTRTSTCARRAGRTRRRSRAAPPQPQPAATARSSRCRTPIPSSTRRRCSARSSRPHAARRSCRPASWPRSRSGSAARS